MSGNTSFNGRESSTVAFTYQDTFGGNLGVGTASNPTNLNEQTTYSDGGQLPFADRVYSYMRSVNANTTDNFNIGNGSVNDPLNLALTMVRVKLVRFQLLSPVDDTTNGTNCNSITYAMLGGPGGITDATNTTGLRRRVFNGGVDMASIPTATGVNANLACSVVNESLTLPANYIVTIYGSTT